MFTKIIWFSLITVIFLGTISMAFIFPEAWAKWTFGGLAFLELIVFYLLDLLRKSSPLEENTK